NLKKEQYSLLQLNKNTIFFEYKFEITP
ncbi:hypothetical protein, partial [Acinetobacter pittii]